MKMFPSCCQNTVAGLNIRTCITVATTKYTFTCTISVISNLGLHQCREMSHHLCRGWVLLGIGVESVLGGMGIKYGRGWGGARISLSRGSVLSREYFPSSYISGFTLLTVYLYFVFLYLAAFKRHYALRLAIAPEFFYGSYMCLFYVCSLGCCRWNKICIYVCNVDFRFISRETLDLTALYFKLYMILDNHNGQVFAASAMIIAN